VQWRTIKTQFGRNALPAHLTPIQDRIAKLVDADEGREKVRGAPRHKTQQMKDAEASLDVSVHDAVAGPPLEIPAEQVAQLDKLDKEILTIEEKIDKCGTCVCPPICLFICCWLLYVPD
jgi:DnaJ-class molecular chaperone